jgi:N-acetylglucosaminyldiphosphoundecaprenol N-acetyl-beta-D-mannosaminyltransferase
MIYSGASLVFYPRFCRRLLKETVPGSRLVPKLASLGDENSWRIFLLGGAAGVGESVKAIWRREFPNLQVETSSADPNQPKVLEQIKSLEPHLILVAYGASDQLAWLEENLPKLPAPVVGIGIGGTLDMLAHARSIDSKGIGRAHQSPRLIEKLGLSWLWRLIMEPWRARRTIVAVPKFIGAVLEYKRSNI